ncbi:MAG: hypothetical protein ABSD43_09665 [Terracidiphilus sp.]|jgi:hypothetical protein
MNERSPGTEPVECEEITYRALKKGWDKGEPIPSEAFMRRVREPEPEKAVSLSRRKYVTARECRLKLRRKFGTASLHVGRVRALSFGLDIAPDPLRDDRGAIIEPGHCLLINLPDPVTDSEGAEFAASQLVKIARYITPNQEEQEHRERGGSV